MGLPAPTPLQKVRFRHRRQQRGLDAETKRLHPHLAARRTTHYPLTSVDLHRRLLTEWVPHPLPLQAEHHHRRLTACLRRRSRTEESQGCVCV